MALRELEQAIAGAVRRTEEYIYENWNRPIRIDELIAITGISARSLFHSFKKAHGYSPIAFAKMVRLNNAKKSSTARTRTFR
jgi:transcriptional regulator GlxA family with amidase domain